jgi:hypothetical protein
MIPVWVGMETLQSDGIKSNKRGWEFPASFILFRAVKYNIEQIPNVRMMP